MTQTSESPFLRLRGIRRQFGDHVAVHDLDLDIRRGEFVTLLGPSGCGKTTLLRMIAGFERPDAGSITLEGSDLGRLAPERRPLNMVFQSYALFPHMDVFDNVAYGLRIAGASGTDVRARVDQALALVGLERSAQRRIQQLSGGMSQRVALARAIVNEPSVLLLDEPLGALDLQLRKRMQVELRAIQDRLGTTFIYVTHDQEEALVMSHRVVLMLDGRIVQIGTPADVYDSPGSRFAAEFVGEATLVPCRVTSALGGEVVLDVGAGRTVQARSCGPSPAAVGEHGHIALRPEHLQLVDADAGSFVGTVRDRIFLGSATHVLVDVQGTGQQLRVVAGDAAATAGDRVGVVALDGRGVYVADDGGPAAPDPAATAPVIEQEVRSA